MKNNRPSATAMLIAAATVAAARDRRLAGIVAPGAAEWSVRFLAATPAGRFLARIAGSRFGPAAARCVEWGTMPDIVAHFQARKQFIEQQVRLAAAEGFDRLIILGAGLDTLATRLASEPAGPFSSLIEVDHPATQRPKSAVLERAALPRPIRLIALDLGTCTVAQAITSDRDPDDAGRDTVVVAEGLLMYLDEESVRRLFEQMAALRCRRLRIVFTFMDRVAGWVGFQPQGRLVCWWLARFGEPFRWGASEDEVARMLASSGWRLREIAGPQELRQGSGLGAGHLKGENSAVADRS